MDGFSVLSWNIRGIGNFTAWNSVKDLIHKHNSSIINILETKCSDLSTTVKDFIWPIANHDWLISPSQGLSKGLIISWDISRIRIVENQVSRSWIWIRGCLNPRSIVFNMVNVYAPQEITGKRLLWHDLSQLLNRRKGEPFCILRDFNCIREVE